MRKISKSTTQKHFGNEDDRMQWSTIENTCKEENNITIKLKGSEFMTITEQVISQPNTDFSSIWLHLL
jgi:hypothetical protein